MSFATVDPATGEVLARFDEHDDAEVERRLATAERAFATHRRTTFAERARRLRAAAALLEADRERLATLMTREMGKPIAAARAEIDKCAAACHFYADHGERFLADEPVDGAEHPGFIRYQPLGIVLAIMPWNFPFWQVFRFAAPALMAGNVGVLKHAASVPQCALAIEAVLHQAGFDHGEFQTLLIGSKRVEAVIRDARVRAVTLTGSENAGAAVARTAGEEIKKSVLELGGSDPFIVMPSASLEDAVETAVRARTVNNGQSCIAAKRFLVHRDIYDAFTVRFVEAMRALRVGDPMAEDTQLGPLATGDIRDDLHEQVRRSIDAGARVLCGGEPLDRPGFFYPATVLADIPAGSPPEQEEFFGPVASLFPIDDIDDAIRRANQTSFGLGASAWTNDADEQRRFIDEIDAGLVFINAMVASDPRLPFGGIKRSGFGRELGSHGIREFVNIKTAAGPAIPRT